MTDTVRQFVYNVLYVGELALCVVVTYVGLPQLNTWF